MPGKAQWLLPRLYLPGSRATTSVVVSLPRSLRLQITDCGVTRQRRCSAEVKGGAPASEGPGLCRHAAECYEKLSESPPEWSDGMPLVVFCEESMASLTQRCCPCWSLPSSPECFRVQGSTATCISLLLCKVVMPDNVRRMKKDPRVYVWVAGVGSRRGADGVLRRLMENAALEPNTVLPVNGRTPGVVLQFSTLPQVCPAQTCTSMHMRASVKPATPFCMPSQVANFASRES